MFQNLSKNTSFLFCSYFTLANVYPSISYEEKERKNKVLQCSSIDIIINNIMIIHTQWGQKTRSLSLTISCVNDRLLNRSVGRSINPPEKLVHTQKELPVGLRPQNGTRIRVQRRTNPIGFCSGLIQMPVLSRERCSSRKNRNQQQTHITFLDVWMYGYMDGCMHVCQEQLHIDMRV
jgi:hypothetical protein